MKKLIMLALISFCANAEDGKVTWQNDLTASQSLIDQAFFLKNSEAEFDTMTRLRYQQYFDIKPDVVSRTVTLIDFYPSFLDTEEYGSKSIYFDKHDQKVEVIAASTISAEGEVTNVAPLQTKLLDGHSENTFTNQRQLVIPLPSLKENSISIVKYKIVTTRKENNPNWANQSYTQRSFPIQDYWLEATWKESDRIQWKADTRDIVCTDQKNGLSCRGEKIKAYSHDNSTRWQDHIGRVEISDYSDWQQVIEQASKAMSQAENNTKGLDEIYSELVKEANNIEEKISNILSFVARDIRYISMSEEKNSITPHTLQETLSNRYGDCKDKSTLLKALLAKAGIETKLVLVDTDRFNQNSMLLPAMNHFNHVVVCFDLSNKTYCLDPTDNLTNWQSTPNWIQGKASLVLDNNQLPTNIKINPYRWRFSNEVKLRFDQQGGQLEHQYRTYLGEYASYYRQELVSRNEDEQRNFLENEYAEEVSSLATPSFSTSNTHSMANQLTIESSAEFNSLLDPTIEKLEYYENDAWLMYELSSMKLKNDWHNEFFSGISISSYYEFDLTNSPWALNSLPSTVLFKHKYGSMTRTINTVEENKLKVLTKLKIHAQEVPGEDIIAFNQFMQILNDHAPIRFTALNK